MHNSLEFKEITKTFPGVKALDNISFSVEMGSVHGLVGENGAGKSTLLNILSGAINPDKGNIIINGEEKYFSNTREALNAGIAVIYQELNLVPEMTIAENLMIGKYPHKKGFVNFKELREKCKKQIDLLLDDVLPETKVKDLSIGQKQMVEIGKALLHDAKIIAFDEPTSSLSEREINRLFEIINNLKEQNRSIIYVSHKMEEILKICDSCTVFRDGKHIDTYKEMKGIKNDILVRKMVGREIKDMYGYEPRELGDIILEVENLFGEGINKKVNLKVAAGEIVGLFGLVGAGRTELLKLIYGVRPLKSGKIKIRGKSVEIKSPQSAIKNKICLLPEDRKDEGIIETGSVSDNINISSRRHMLKYNLFLDKKKEKSNADKFIKELDIKTPSREQIILNLSGGNQQKVIFSRWLSEDMEVFLLDEPTRGIDVGVKSEIYKIIYQLAHEGKCVILVSSELPEVLGVSDRIVVMRNGEIAGSLKREEANEETILSMALPVS